MLLLSQAQGGICVHTNVRFLRPNTARNPKVAPISHRLVLAGAWQNQFASKGTFRLPCQCVCVLEMAVVFNTVIFPLWGLQPLA
jgi:hypothetical protein